MKRRGSSKRQKTKRQPSAQDRPLLSLSIIARDAGATIERCINSVRSAVDEVCVIDTGSTDNTTLLARELGAKVIARPWVDSFAVARNHALRMCKGEYVLWMDCDEVLDPEDLADLRPLVEAREADLYTCLSFVDGSYQAPEQAIEGFGQGTVVPKPRIFLNAPGVCWRWRVHECLHYPSGGIERLGETDLRFRHEGTMTLKKRQYYTALLTLDHLDNTKDPHPAMYLAALDVMEARYDEAIQRLEGCDLSIVPLWNHSVRNRYQFFLGQAWNGKAAQAETDEERRKCYIEALEAYSLADSSLARLQAAIIHVCLDRLPHALDILEKSLEVDPGHLMLTAVRGLVLSNQGHGYFFTMRQIEIYLEGLTQNRAEARQQGAEPPATPKPTQPPRAANLGGLVATMRRPERLGPLRIGG